MNKLKLFYYIWGILLVALLAASLFLDMNTSMLVVTIIVLFGGAAFFRYWKKTLVEITVEEDAVHLVLFDGQKRSVIPEGIVLIKAINGGFLIGLKDKSEYHVRKGKFTVKKGDVEIHEFRREYFPYAEFRMEK